MFINFIFKLFFNFIIRIDNLASKTKDTSTLQGNVGIAHTRWATHGGVTEENTHPHRDCSGNIALVHNGIIENYRELKAELSDHHFSSETDTEVLAHLIEKNYAGNLREAIQKALVKVRGTYGLVVFDRREPDKIIVALWLSSMLRTTVASSGAMETIVRFWS
jgi:glucosamine--fructose-6-phosphate aminotransferase (isomerizing)